MDSLEKTPVELNHIETPAKTSIATLPENLSIQENLSNKASVSRGAVLMSTNSAFQSIVEGESVLFLAVQSQPFRVLKRGRSQ